MEDVCCSVMNMYPDIVSGILCLLSPIPLVFFYSYSQRFRIKALIE